MTFLLGNTTTQISGPIIN